MGEIISFLEYLVNKEPSHATIKVYAATISMRTLATDLSSPTPLLNVSYRGLGDNVR